MLRFFSILLLILPSSTAYALDELIDSTWLKNNIIVKDLFLLDIRQPKQYRRFHIPGSINAPYETWRTDNKSKKAGVLPPLNQMERFISELGISNDSAVIIISSGIRPKDMAAASRVFWTLKVLGHRNVGVLNGGLSNYAKRFPHDLEVIPRSRTARKYKITPANNIIADSNDTLAALHTDIQLLDARTLGEYVGVITAKPAERSGTIPGAKHLPFDWLIDDHGLIRNKKESSTLYKSTGLNPNKDGTIHFCHSGNRAALTWFVDYVILGNRNAKLYDSSMSEWATRESLPMESQIILEKTPNNR